MICLTYNAFAFPMVHDINIGLAHLMATIKWIMIFKTTEYGPNYSSRGLGKAEIK